MMTEHSGIQRLMNKRVRDLTHDELRDLHAIIGERLTT
jgi:hypothetical protein